MSSREFIASLVSSLTWPVAVAVGIWLFRRQIRTLLEGPIKRWKVGPLEFENEWASATERVGESVVTREALARRDDELDDLLALAEKAPVPTILAAHQAVEEMVRSLGVAAGIDDAQNMSVGKLSAALAQRGLIDAKTDSALRGLVTLRNLAAHGPATEGRRATEYIVLAEAVLYALSQSQAARGERSDIAGNDP